VFAATSNPGALWRFGPGRAEKGELLSPVLDAKRVAGFGRLMWRGELNGSHAKLEGRSGNTDAPDTTWSNWGGGNAEQDGVRSGAPPARFFQWRLTLSGGTPRLESIEAAWREINQPPVIGEIAVGPQGQGFREGEMQPRMEPVTQSLAGGQKVEYTLPPAQTAKQLRDLPMWARGLRTVQWKAVDPNGDALRYRVDMRLEPSGPWIKVASDLEASAFTWDTNGLPDGRYRLRISASDATANPVGEERSAEALGPPFTIDNTPPEVNALSARGVTRAVEVEGKAADAASTITRVEVSLDDGDWRNVTPDGGFADQRSLGFHATLRDVDPGAHTVSVRVVDSAGNPATRATHVTVPGAK
jgi:hypothetical protein